MHEVHNFDAAQNDTDKCMDVATSLFLPAKTFDNEVSDRADDFVADVLRDVSNIPPPDDGGGLIDNKIAAALANIPPPDDDGGLLRLCDYQ